MNHVVTSYEFELLLNSCLENAVLTYNTNNERFTT